MYFGKLIPLLLVGLAVGLSLHGGLCLAWGDAFLSLRLPWCLGLSVVGFVILDGFVALGRRALRAPLPALRPHIPHLIALGLYLFCLAAMFWPALPGPTPGRRFMAASDFRISFYPAKSWASRELAQGRLPLWNPNLCLGIPAHAEMTQSAFYPLSLPLALLTGSGRLPYQAYFWFAALHMVIAAWGTYLLCRTWRISFSCRLGWGAYASDSEASSSSISLIPT